MPLFFCTFPYFTVVTYISSCYTFFLLHSFHVVLFSYFTILYCTLLCSNVFMLHFFSCCTLFTNCSISCCTFTSCNLFVLHSSPVALFACCNIVLLHFVHFALFPKVWSGFPQTSKMERFETIIAKAVKHGCKVLHLRCSRGSGCASTISMLHFFHIALFHVALFPCCTLFMLNSCCTLFSIHFMLHLFIIEKC